MTDPITQSMMQGAAGAGGDKVYVDDVFSIDRWQGSSSTRTIDNGMDLLGEGGAVFIKSTDSGSDWAVGGSVIGDGYTIPTNSGSARTYNADRFKSLKSNGFEVGSNAQVNSNSYQYISFAFRKQKQFFDIVSFTGTGSVQSIAHNLGSVPGMMIIKCYSTGSRDWNVYHREIASGTPGNYRLRLDSDAARNNSSSYFNNTAPTATHFTVGTSGDINENGTNFVAYLFAHNEAEFGEDSNLPLMACGSYTGNNGNTDVNIGFEPSFFLVKRADGSGGWVISNTTQAYGKDDTNTDPTDAKTVDLNAGTSMTTTNARISQYPSGIRIRNESQGFCNENGARYIYLAVRTSVGLAAKIATSGTDVFDAGIANSASCPPGSWPKGFEVDFVLHKGINATDNWEAATRKSGQYRWFPNITSGLPSTSSGYQWDSSTGMGEGISSSNMIWGWKRSRGFDVQFNRSEGAGTYPHNLGQVPEMIWTGSLQRNDWHGVGHHKLRTADPWNYIAYMNNTSAGNSGAGYWNNTAPTATHFTVGNNEAQSYYGIMFILWCSVPGICKIDAYDGDGGTTNQVDCGFQPRYVMIKRVDSSGDWKIWDYSRGNNVLRLNLTNGQVNDVLVSFTSTGFTLISPDGTVNASGGRYIYHAQA